MLCFREYVRYEDYEQDDLDKGVQFAEDDVKAAHIFQKPQVEKLREQTNVNNLKS